MRFLQRELRVEGEVDDGQLSLDGGDEQDVAAAEVVRARAVLDLSTCSAASSRSAAGRGCCRTSSYRWSACSAEMERLGIAADDEHLAHLSAHFGAEVKDAEQSAYAVLGREVNLGSPKQLQVVLFDELELPKTKRIKTGYTTDAEALQELYVKTEHPFLGYLLRHRDVSRLKTVIDGLLPMIDDAGRIHTTYNQMIASTGRLSSTDPNLQNIPIRTEEGRQIREAFVVGPGLRVPAHRRLQPDRDADHGASVGGCRR